MSYNVHTQRDDLSALAATVRAARPDVVIVQEGPRRWRWRTACARLAHRLGLVVAAGGLPSLGNVVLTSLRVGVTAGRSLRYPLTPGRHLRGATFVDCVVAGRRFTVAGTHLSTDPAERPAQARLFAAAARAVAGPLIVGADLNDDPGGPAYRALAEGLTDLAVEAGDARPTYPVAGACRRIDVLLAAGGPRLLAYDVLDTPDSRRASDHFPVLARLALP
ncbi:endonuclease/exonuclease/phosphatase family protein [Pilimelia terevasa]|nr:endonuclease/exonuclease/phosphatase family protein [Pilimelia terevasa]